MNPHAKEFVPAHLLKQRKEEADRIGELAEQIGQVGIRHEDQQKSESTTMPTTTTASNTNTPPAAFPNKATTVENGNRSCGTEGDNDDSNKEPTNTTTPTTTQKPTAQTSPSSNCNNHSTNGKRQDINQNEDDRYLLKGGEAFCEFNGEQFIIPGEDEEYDQSSGDHEQQYRKPDFDFGNDEDNEDEEVCTAYEQFLDTLPE